MPVCQAISGCGHKLRGMAFARVFVSYYRDLECTEIRTCVRNPGRVYKNLYTLCGEFSLLT